jgi:hypothetical protein
MKNRLMTAGLRKQLPNLYAQDSLGDDAVAYARYFSLSSPWEWFATEFDGEDTFFGLVNGFEPEFGYFSLSEMERMRIKELAGIPAIERDLYFTPEPVGQILKRIKNSV